ncbi:MAG TPA: class I SAM-dependent DNA methyltransferase, partial [Candidatus Acetothermia bacterium]|nr:class I SAM-dependent DNA methyltransferase [Candidatus Acetothermia bacterium]HEX32778.1 class I SAM-dependent DNA methyltransferase [Candidatus Acetothermia bacterium]
MTPQEFVDKWQRSKLKERSASQEHFIDLCRMLGHPTPAKADPEGTTFTFEKGVDKSSGGQGWADVWKKGFFAWEYKGKHKNLNAAYDQLQLYRDALLNPPLLIVSDMETIVIYTNFT